MEPTYPIERQSRSPQRVFGVMPPAPGAGFHHQEMLFPNRRPRPHPSFARVRMATWGFVLLTLLAWNILSIGGAIIFTIISFVVTSFSCAIAESALETWLSGSLRLMSRNAAPATTRMSSMKWFLLYDVNSFLICATLLSYTDLSSTVSSSTSQSRAATLRNNSVDMNTTLETDAAQSFSQGPIHFFERSVSDSLTFAPIWVAYYLMNSLRSRFEDIPLMTIWTRIRFAIALAFVGIFVVVLNGFWEAALWWEHKPDLRDYDTLIGARFDIDKLRYMVGTLSFDNSQHVLVMLAFLHTQVVITEYVGTVALGIIALLETIVMGMVSRVGYPRVVVKTTVSFFNAIGTCQHIHSHFGSLFPSHLPVVFQYLMTYTFGKWFALYVKHKYTQELESFFPSLRSDSSIPRGASTCVICLDELDPRAEAEMSSSPNATAGDASPDASPSPRRRESFLKRALRWLISGDTLQAKKVKRLPCGHLFHRECLFRWLNDGNEKCPMCRSSVYGAETQPQPRFRLRRGGPGPAGGAEGGPRAAAEGTGMDADQGPVQIVELQLFSEGANRAEGGGEALGTGNDAGRSGPPVFIFRQRGQPAAVGDEGSNSEDSENGAGFDSAAGLEVVGQSIPAGVGRSPSPSPTLRGSQVPFAATFGAASNVASELLNRFGSEPPSQPPIINQELTQAFQFPAPTERPMDDREPSPQSPSRKRGRDDVTTAADVEVDATQLELDGRAQQQSSASPSQLEEDDAEMREPFRQKPRKERSKN
jgi:hypothetical protein